MKVEQDSSGTFNRLTAKQRLLLETVLKDRTRAAQVARDYGLTPPWEQGAPGEQAAPVKRSEARKPDIGQADMGEPSRRSPDESRQREGGSSTADAKGNLSSVGLGAGPGKPLSRLAGALSKASGSMAALASGNPITDMARLLVTLLGDALRVQGEVEEGRESPLVGMRTQGTRSPFFCIHALLGSTFHYFALANLLSEDQPFYALQAPGLEGGAGLKRIEDFAAFYLPFIREVQPRGPYRIGGYSFGGLVAYEIARQLSAQGEEVSHLVIFGTDVPVSQSLPKLFTAVEFASRFGEDALKNLVMPFFSYDKRIEVEQGAGASTYSPALVRVVTAHCLAAARYSPKPYPGSLTLLETLEQQILNPLDAARGWDRLAVGGVETLTVTGNHLSMLDEPHIQDLARKLDMILAGP
ncbi:alpha/beta fold hydrolase [Rhodospirillum sp. A1_3_36]|uniref:thioesterase domain-containing protein n=1 Tax=Rhodospirillum sp. A1_3_36 TaxID=3391666 RepID=UPI0039A56B0C